MNKIKEKEIYLITYREAGTNHIWRYYNIENARKDYASIKRHKVSGLKLSKVINL